MKCDELETEQWLDYGGEPMPCYPAKDVDEAIAELKAENDRLKEALHRLSCNADCCYRVQFKSTRRALWLARAERAKTEYKHWILIWYCELNNHLFFINKTRYKNRAKVDRLYYPWEWRDIWDEVERKCRAKAEEYK